MLYAIAAPWEIGKFDFSDAIFICIASQVILLLIRGTVSIVQCKRALSHDTTGGRKQLSLYFLLPLLCMSVDLANAPDRMFSYV